MQRKLTWVWGLIAVLFLGSAYSLWPTFRLASMDEAEKLAAEQRNPADWIRLKNRAIKLGLDLRGGMRVVMEVDKSKLNAAEAKDAVDRAKEIIRNRVDQFGVSEPLIQKQGEDRIVIELPGITDIKRAEELIGQTAQLEFKLLEPRENVIQILDRIDLVLEKQDTTAKREEQPPKSDDVFDIFSDTLDLADTAATDTSVLAATGGDSATADSGEMDEAPSLGDRPFSTLLEPVGDWFRVVKEDAAWIRRWLEDPKVQNEIPQDVQIVWGTRSGFAGGLEVEYLYFLKANVEMSGKYLTDARPGFDQFRKPKVDFTLTRAGGRIFARLTGANIGKALAIVLDDRIVSAPTIESRIPDRGQITMGGSDYEAAADLAIMLRAGALPSDVKFIENNIIGPSLGADSVRKGVTSVATGLALVLLFMLVYYRLSGIIADFALLINLVFLLAVMATLHATLTMPGIAGIILTIGISVDSNVLIFERIREELRTGKTVRASIDAGYKRALVAIVDSHVTTLITALALFLLGTGPIKGFAVTLAWGVGISLFTAFVITKAIFDLRKGYKTLSI
jgi:protein-export membrane protein SecD